MYFESRYVKKNILICTFLQKAKQKVICFYLFFILYIKQRMYTTTKNVIVIRLMFIIMIYKH